MSNDPKNIYYSKYKRKMQKKRVTFRETVFFLREIMI